MAKEVENLRPQAFPKLATKTFHPGKTTLHDPSFWNDFMGI